jgi:hypothetical protein
MKITVFQGHTTGDPVLSGSSAPTVTATSGPTTEGLPAKTQTVETPPPGSMIAPVNAGRRVSTRV